MKNLRSREVNYLSQDYTGIVIVTQLCKYIKNHGLLHLKQIYFICKLPFNVIKRKKKKEKTTQVYGRVGRFRPNCFRRCVSSSTID